MPISCPIHFPRLSTEEFGALDYGFMKLSFASHKEDGRLADETIYQADFAARLVDAGYEVQREVPITVSFRSFVKTYYQVFIHLLGGEGVVTNQVPMGRGDVPLGKQRFHLLEPDAAFRITAFTELTKGYEGQLQRLLTLSPLKAMHWINIGYEEVTFTTIQ